MPRIIIPTKALALDDVTEIFVNAVIKSRLPEAWPLDEDFLQELIERSRHRFTSWFESKLPKTHQTVGVSLSRPKTTALIFDRLWAPPEFGWRLPDDMVVYGATQHEVIVQLYVHLASLAKRHSKRKANQISKGEFTVGDLVGTIGAVQNISEVQDDDGIRQLRVRDAADLMVCLTLNKVCKLTTTPLYGSREARNADFKSGNRSVLWAIIENVALVDETQLQWEQVIEFRRDEQARFSYRRFLHWLDSSMANQTESYIVDEVSVRLESYQWSLKKHGIRTVIGAIEAAFDERSLLASAIGAAALSGAGFAAAISAALAIVTGKVAISVSRNLLDLTDVRVGPNSEVAYVHAVQKEFGTGLKGS